MGSQLGEEGPRPVGSPYTLHKATPELRPLQTSLVLCGPMARGHTDSGGSQGHCSLVTCMTAFLLSISFCQNCLCEKPECLCGPGGESRGARWGTKKAEEREMEKTLYSPQSLCRTHSTWGSWSSNTVLKMPLAPTGSTGGGAQETSPPQSLFLQATNTFRLHLI